MRRQSAGMRMQAPNEPVVLALGTLLVLILPA